jgi:hypothetical protein
MRKENDRIHAVVRAHCSSLKGDICTLKAVRNTKKTFKKFSCMLALIFYRLKRLIFNTYI